MGRERGLGRVMVARAAQHAEMQPPTPPPFPKTKTGIFGLSQHVDLGDFLFTPGNFFIWFFFKCKKDRPTHTRCKKRQMKNFFETRFTFLLHGFTTSALVRVKKNLKNPPPQENCLRSKGTKKII